MSAGVACQVEKIDGIIALLDDWVGLSANGDKRRRPPPAFIRLRAVRITVLLIVGVIFLAGIGFEAWTLTGRSLPGTILALCALPILFAPVVWFVRKTPSD